MLEDEDDDEGDEGPPVHVSLEVGVVVPESDHSMPHCHQEGEDHLAQDVAVLTPQNAAKAIVLDYWLILENCL